MKLKKMIPLFITPLLLSGCGTNKHANVGLLYCSAESNSLYQVKVVEEELKAKGLSTKRIPFADSNDLSPILNSAIGSVDTIYVPTDNICASNAGIINGIVREKKVPVFAGEEGICEGCGAITLSISYYNIGVKTGEMAVDVLLGRKDIKEMAIAYDENPVKKYNKKFCDEMNITVPSDYVELGASGSGDAAITITNQNTENKKFTIGISQLITHDALDAATRGFKDAVKAGLGEANVTFDEKNAAGDSNNCNVIATTFVSRGVDLIMANATPALQSAASATDIIPILGTSVTEYGTALNIKDFDGVVGKNISGTSDLAPLKDQADMLATVFKDYMK